MNNKIVVLLAVYNGEKWLEKQIKSIRDQKNVDVTIIINIDFSDDSSLFLCQKLVDEKIKILPYGHRYGGAAANFFHLLRTVDLSGFDYVSLSDQDDIWNDTKLFNAIEKMQDTYDAYSSNVTAFWNTGQQYLIEKAQPQTDFDYVFEAAGPGCTYVLRKNLALHFQSFLISNYSKASMISLHDWLIYAFARSMNYKWIIDSRSGMLYRQHEHNQIGANKNLQGAVKRIKLIKSSWYRSEVKKITEILPKEKISFIKESLQSGYKGNLLLAIHVNKFRRRIRDRFFLILILVIGWF